MRTLKITFRHLVHWRSLGPFQLSDLLLEVKSWGSGKAWIGPLNTVYAARGFQAHLVVSRPFQRPICHKEPTSSITAQAAVILCWRLTNWCCSQYRHAMTVHIFLYSTFSHGCPSVTQRAPHTTEPATHSLSEEKKCRKWRHNKDNCLFNEGVLLQQDN